MTKPILTEEIGGYSIRWPDYEIEARVSRVHVHSDGHVTGMLSLTHQNGQGPIRLMPASQFNFSADRTRSMQAKQLAEKYPLMVCNWMEMFDYLGEAVQHAALAGSPAVEILADYEAPAPTLLVDPLIYQGHQNIIFGEKGVNKSTLAYALAIFLALYETPNPLGLKINATRPVRSLVLDWETDEHTFRWYLGKLARGLNTGPVPVFYRHCRLPLAQDIEPIADEIQRTGAELLIIDSLAAAASGDSGELKGGGAALDFNAGLRKLPGITSLIIGQTSKSAEGKKTIFGSTLFQYYARNIFELCRGEDTDTGILHLGLFHRECNLGRKAAPIGIRMQYHDDGSISMEREALSVDEFMQKVSVPMKIMAMLAHGPMSRKEIVEELKEAGETITNIDMPLGRLLKAGKITRLPDKRYGLVGPNIELTPN